MSSSIVTFKHFYQHLQNTGWDGRIVSQAIKTFHSVGNFYLNI